MPHRPVYACTVYATVHTGTTYVPIDKRTLCRLGLDQSSLYRCTVDVVTRSERNASHLYGWPVGLIPSRHCNYRLPNWQVRKSLWRKDLRRAGHLVLETLPRWQLWCTDVSNRQLTCVHVPKWHAKMTCQNGQANPVPDKLACQDGSAAKMAGREGSKWQCQIGMSFWQGRSLYRLPLRELFQKSKGPSASESKE